MDLSNNKEIREGKPNCINSDKRILQNFAKFMPAHGGSGKNASSANEGFSEEEVTRISGIIDTNAHAFPLSINGISTYVSPPSLNFCTFWRHFFCCCEIDINKLQCECEQNYCKWAQMKHEWHDIMFNLLRLHELSLFSLSLFYICALTYFSSIWLVPGLVGFLVVSSCISLQHSCHTKNRFVCNLYSKKVFLLAHCCHPNSSWSPDKSLSDKTLTIRANVPIAKGSMISVAYDDSQILVCTLKRVIPNEINGMFVCKCKRCTGIHYISLNLQIS